MKKKLITGINLVLLVILIVLNIVCIIKYSLNNDSLLMIVLATMCILLYFFGIVFTDTTVKIIHAISLKLYKNSGNINVPCFVEAKRTFKNRLIYILICCNVCLLMSLLTYLFN